MPFFVGRLDSPTALDLEYNSEVDEQTAASSSTAPVDAVDDVDQEDNTGLRQRKSGKWGGQANNQLEKTTSGGRKMEYTPSFVTKAEARAALKELKARIDKEYDEYVTKLAMEDPRAKDLPRGSEDIRYALPKTVYWMPNRLDGHKPMIVVRIAQKGTKHGFHWITACQDPGCTNIACQSHASKGGKREFCKAHGGMECAHGHDWTRCMHCNGGQEGKKRTDMCSECNSVVIDAKRRLTKGGNGLCVNCEQQKGEAKSQRWEDFMLDGNEKTKGICTLVTDKEGRVITYEMRDDFKNMLGSNKRRRQGECDTDHQRRPDVLWVKRDEDGYICAAIMVEIDENSHGDRTTACEGGKIHDTFAAIVHHAQTEGKNRLGVVRKGKVHHPYVLFLRVNPSACDAKDGPFKTKTRIKVTAAAVSEFLQTPPEFFHEMAESDNTMLPHVQCLYYHSKEGGDNLEFYKAHDDKALHFRGNACPRAAGDLVVFH